MEQKPICEHCDRPVVQGVVALATEIRRGVVPRYFHTRCSEYADLAGLSIRQIGTAPKAA